MLLFLLEESKITLKGKDYFSFSIDVFYLHVDYMEGIEWMKYGEGANVMCYEHFQIYITLSRNWWLLMIIY